MQADSEKFPQSRSGSLYPTNYVVGIIDDPQEAEQAEQAFKAAGYDAGDVRLFTGSEAVEKARELEKEKSWFQRFLSRFQGTTDEAGASVYQQEARQGHTILNVRVDSRRDIDTIRDLMTQFHTHTIQFFGRWDVEDLPPRDPQRH